jgi:membrane-associated protease RseP (regulator of RpoE activity)
MLARWKRLTRVTSAIRLRGALLCGEKLSPVLGVIAATRDELPKAYREPAERRYGVEDQVKVLWVLPGYPADRAGLRARDTVLEIDGRKTRSARTLHSRGAKSVGEIISLRVERNGEFLDLEVEAVKGCYHAAYLEVLDFVNAYADGARIVVFTGLMRFLTSDDDLALIVGHELAHNILGHPWSRPVFEAEADYLGCYLAARSGFDVSGAGEMWRRWGREHPYGLDRRAGRSHPTSPARAVALERTVNEILGKLGRSEPLVPRIE